LEEITTEKKGFLENFYSFGQLPPSHKHLFINNNHENGTTWFQLPDEQIALTLIFTLLTYYPWRWSKVAKSLRIALKLIL
jgi:hypothetical protein